ncbi:hypothetical protein CAEBREN_24181 [Caenorhabditis brenneri]|uniref:Galectin domain-containing protein n=1 Tax=Caenorhabditis brenneri TaxID=135651 RepID=G0NSU9_CAEBE|nr:hypothetical protein CAEBREN_24181 [Caenorhabditis brenneri]
MSYNLKAYQLFTVNQSLSINLRHARPPKVRYRDCKTAVIEQVSCFKTQLSRSNDNKTNNTSENRKRRSQISIDDQWFKEYDHRLPMEDAQQLTISGEDAIVNSIDIYTPEAEEEEEDQTDDNTNTTD